MPQFTLPSHSVSYNLYTVLNAADKQIQRSVAGLEFQVPVRAVQAANAGAIVEVGRPDSVATPTTISSAEMVMAEGDSAVFPAQIGNNISLAERYINASVDNAVIFCVVTQA